METDQQLLREILATQQELLGEIKAMRRLLEQNGKKTFTAERLRVEPVTEGEDNVVRKKDVVPADASGGDALVKALVQRNRMAQDAMSFVRRTKK